MQHKYVPKNKTELMVIFYWELAFYQSHALEGIWSAVVGLFIYIVEGSDSKVPVRQQKLTVRPITTGLQIFPI